MRRNWRRRWKCFSGFWRNRFLKGPVVSNTSPLIALAKINQLTIFSRLFGVVFVPESVSNEFLQNSISEEAKRLNECVGNTIKIFPVISEFHFTRQLGLGERDAISLAIQKNALLIIDDKKGRSEAIEKALTVVSTRAVLKLAERAGFIKSFSDSETELRKKNFFLPFYG